MLIYLLRHGRTADNDARRYQGKRDTPLSPEGEAELFQADFSPATVYVSPRGRVCRTAALVFPHSHQIVVDELREMDFGVFEGRSAAEMEDDADYRAWVDGGCVDRCPGGESRGAFSERICAAFSELVEEALKRGSERLVIVAHGGTQMAVLGRFALPKRDYFQWFGSNGGGFVLETDGGLWASDQNIRLLDTISFVKEETGC